MNPQQKKQAIIAAVLGIVLIIVLYIQLAPKSGQKKPAPKVPAVQTAAGPSTAKPGAAKAPANMTGKSSVAVAAQAEATELKSTDIDIDQLLANVKEVDFDYDRERVPRDPMMKLIGKTFAVADEKKEDEANLRNPTVIAYMKKVVSGIMWDEKKPLAIVDNEVVGSGYQYPDGGIVKSITRDQVVFQVGDSQIEVPLKEL